MILVGSQRGGGGALARHLSNDVENDHIEIVELRGFVSETMPGAFAEIEAVANGTRCKQPFFSLSLNPPKQSEATLEDMIAAADQAEERLGLKGQPRVIVAHEKEGRRHIHAVWSRIDAEKMKAVGMPYFANKLAALSKELYLEHGWTLPEGHRENGWKNPLNFTLAEWQQAKRIGLDPREIKQQFAEAWKQSDGLKAFQAALEEKGYYLARGDRRGFVAIDVNGEVFSVARYTGVKTKDVTAKLGAPERLPTVDQTFECIGNLVHEQRRERLVELRDTHRADLAPLMLERKKLLAAQRQERERLHAGQERRLKAENDVRQGRVRKGVRGLLDIVTGRAATIRKQNDIEAFAGYRRDRAEREGLFRIQFDERADLQARIAAQRKAHRLQIMSLAANVRKLFPDRTSDASKQIARRSRDHELEP